LSSKITHSVVVEESFRLSFVKLQLVEERHALDEREEREENDEEIHFYFVVYSSTIRLCEDCKKEALFYRPKRSTGIARARMYCENITVRRVSIGLISSGNRSNAMTCYYFVKIPLDENTENLLFYRKMLTY
jgi:hypothetical protein